MSDTFGLTNKQIVYLYLQNKKLADFLNDLLNQGYLSNTMTFDLGELKIEADISPEQLLEIIAIDKIEMILSIDKTLEPIVEMISTSLPEEYMEVSNLVESLNTDKMEEEDDEDEEDAG